MVKSRGLPVGMPLSPLRDSTGFGIDAGTVAGCLDPIHDRRDALFAKAWEAGPAALTRAERCAVAGVTGHVAESVTELLLDGVGWRVIWHFPGPGRHGVDLVFLAPYDKVVVVEVKGTLVGGRVPRLSSRETTQMSAAWLDKRDNPGMTELGLASADIYGGVSVINFADLTWQFAVTPGLPDLRPVRTREQLADLSWLKRA